MLSETEVIVRATRSRVASVPGELSFSVGDVIVYLPQRGRSGATGMAMGRLGAGEGLFPPSFTELANDSSVSAPAAHPLALEPDAGGASSAIDQQRGMPILPQGRQSLRLAVWDVFNDPESCKAAQVVMIWVMSLIIISTIAFVAESMPEFHVRGGPDPTWPEFWDTMETVIVLQFSLEYLARLVVCSSYDASYFVAAARFIIEPMNVVDLVAILPWYLELLGLAGSGSAILRVFRLARVVRIFKLGKYAAGLQMFARTLLASADALLLLVFIISITTILFASMIYYAERGEWSTTNEQWEVTADTPTQFTSIPAAFWWCLVTLTTVGYGDVVPKTLAGMLVAVATMVCGVLTIALPVSIVGSNFQMEYEKLEREKKKRQQAAEAVEASHKVELISPLQQELSKLSELLDEMDGLAKLAAAKQGSIARIANSAVFEQAVTQGA